MSRKKASSKTKAAATEAVAAEGEAATMAVKASVSEGAVNEAETEAATAERADNKGQAVVVEVASETKPYDGLSLVDADALDAIEASSIETTLADVDEAALEAGIASVFDSIRTGGIHVPANDDAGTSDQERADAASPDEDDRTIALLAELNRLWAQPLAA
jgi:hypothetical protein